MEKPVRTVWTSLTAVLAGFFMSAPSVAQSPIEINATAPATLTELIGEWGFSTQNYRSGLCQMSGNLIVFPGREDETSAACSMTAVEICGTERSVVEQSCQISLEGNGAVIVSEIEQFIERKPNSLGYLPDNFILSEVSPSEMSGTLQSAVSASVIFRRVEGAIS